MTNDAVVMIGMFFGAAMTFAYLFKRWVLLSFIFGAWSAWILKLLGVY